VSGREREGEAGSCGTDGPKEGAGPCGEHGPHAGERKEKGRRVQFGLEEGRWAARERKEKGGKEVGWREVGPCGEKERRGWLGWAGLEERREGEKRYFFQTLFQTFEIGLFSKHSKIFKTFLKAFKTSHKQIIKPCIQIMMHKHLLLLNY
jgi:hypothetical protein